MKHITTWVALAGISLLLHPSATAQSPTPVAANGQLKVINRQLCNQSGKPIQLRGMSSHGLQYFPQCFNASSVQALASSWGIDVFRSAMYIDEGGYVTDKTKYRAFIDNLVDWTGQNGVYNIIDWHILNPGDPNVHVADAKEFFQIEAQKHAGKKNVIYEICNEPNGVDWNTIKGYAEQIIPIIRQYDPEALILVGTPGYSGLPGDVRSNPLTGANAYNVMYTFHFYAGSHYTESYIDDVLKTVPLFISEWGTSNYSGNGGNDYSNSQNWMNLLAGQNSSGIKVSWCNWNFSDNSETSAALTPGSCNSGNWNSTSTSGAWVKDHILNPADDFGPVTPSVALTSPSPNTTAVIGSNVVLTVSVSSATATSVEFYNGLTKLGQATAAPYSYTISSIQAGTYSFTAKALLSSGNPLISSAVSVTAVPAPNQAPTVTLTTPANGGTFAGPATLTLTATASDADGSVAKVAFYSGGQKLAEITTAPYTYVWSNVPFGTYALTAQATDNKGATTTSGVATVIINDPNAPQGDIVGPNCAAKNAVLTFAAGSGNLPNATSFSWWCTGSTSSIAMPQPGQASINFGPSFTGGQVCVGINYSASPWYKQFCKDVTLCTGTPTTPPANQPPAVALTTPANNATYAAPATINMAASASDADGSVTKVEFFNGSTSLGIVTAAPYQYAWTSVPVGTYTLTAKATDNQGATTTSTAVVIGVKAPAPVNQPPAVALTTPANNASFTAPATINIAASASDADGSVAKVEFFNGSTKLGETTTMPYQYAWINVGAGTYTLVAKATDNQGATTTSAISTVSVVVPPASTTQPAGNTDLNGPDYVKVNDVKLYTLSTANLTNATSFSWWCTGSTSSITVNQGQATINFGPWFTGGDVCAGINYSASPWYKQVCKHVQLSPANGRIAADDGSSIIYPNPATNQFLFVAGQDVQALRAVDLLGREHFSHGPVSKNQSVSFGENFPSGQYLLQVQYIGNRQQAIKLLKVGK